MNGSLDYSFEARPCRSGGNGGVNLKEFSIVDRREKMTQPSQSGFVNQIQSANIEIKNFIEGLMLSSLRCSK